MNKKIIPIVLAFVAIAAIGGYFIWQKYSAPATAQPIAPQPTNNETADWKTYTNSKYEFSFKYPQDWLVNDSSYTYQGKDNEYIEVSSPLISGVPGTSRDAWFYIDISKNSQTWSQKEGVNLRLLHLDGGSIPVNVSQQYLQSMKEFKTSQLIWASLKSVEKTQATDWKTYMNSQYRFEFKYPSNWTLKENNVDGSVVSVDEPVTSVTPKTIPTSQDASPTQQIPITRSVFVYITKKQTLADYIKAYEIDSQKEKTYPTFSINELSSTYLPTSFITQFENGGDAIVSHGCEIGSCSTVIDIPNRGLRINASIDISDSTTFSGDLPNILTSFKFTQ